MPEISLAWFDVAAEQIRYANLPPRQIRIGNVAAAVDPNAAATASLGEAQTLSQSQTEMALDDVPR